MKDFGAHPMMTNRVRRALDAWRDSKWRMATDPHSPEIREAIERELKAAVRETGLTLSEVIGLRNSELRLKFEPDWSLP